MTCFALSGLDIALWDIAGKAAGAPLHRLLGGAARDSVPAYASLLKYRDPPLVARLVGAALEEGYERIKLHESTPPPVAAARRAAGADVPIMLDVNCVWSPAEARRMAGELEESDLHWLEEPLWPPENVDALAELRAVAESPSPAAKTPAPRGNSPPCSRPKRSITRSPASPRSAGVSEFRKITTLAERANISLAPHSPYFGPGFLATLQLLAADSSVEAIERFYVTLDDDLYGGALTPRNGAIAVPDGPGLGLEPNPDFIEKWRER